MALKVYHYPNCSTCKKALAWLRGKAVEFEAVDIVKSPPSRRALADAARTADVPMKKLFNVSGESYRSGNFKTKLADGMTDAEAVTALAADGKLIKRPLVVGDEIALIGFDEASWARALAGGKIG